jgi:hypothetical protein
MLEEQRMLLEAELQAEDQEHKPPNGPDPDPDPEEEQQGEQQGEQEEGQQEDEQEQEDDEKEVKGRREQEMEGKQDNRETNCGADVLRRHWRDPLPRPDGDVLLLCQNAGVQDLHAQGGRGAGGCQQPEAASAADVEEGRRSGDSGDVGADS